MKLIDILVKELPKRDGWNENWMSVTQDSDGYLCCWKCDDPKYNGFGWGHISGRGLSGYFLFDDDDGLSCDNAESIVTRDQYESALAASQKVEWSVDGLPPVGCECEIKFICDTPPAEWFSFKLIGVHDEIAIVTLDGESTWRHISKFSLDKVKFRPLRTEAERKRDEAAKAMSRHANDDENRGFDAGLRNCLSIYDAIAAGKIPGVKLED